MLRYHILAGKNLQLLVIWEFLAELSMKKMLHV